MKKQISLKWKIGRYLVGFAVLTIAVIFLFQVVLLEPMYERSKIQAVKEVSESVITAITNGNDTNTIMRMAAQSDTCVQTYTSISSDGSTGTATVAGSGGCIAYSLTNTDVSQYVALAAENNGSYLTTTTQSQAHPSDNKFGRSDSTTDTNGDQVKNIVYTRVVSINGENDVIIVTGVLTPLSATTNTLSSQMWYIGIFLILAIVILTLVLYKEIAKPLTEINQAAKEIPQGKYEFNPKTNRYLEAQELNDTLKDAAEDIQAADKAKRDLIANVSHDLRTPLTMISGYGEMMQDLPEEKTDENLQVIIDESKRLNSLVNDLLDLSKLQSSKITLTEEDMDITSMIDTQLRKYDVYVMRDGFQIEKELAGSTIVHADMKRMEQVFNNFMTNAINYSGEKKHIIVREKIQGDMVRVEVQDFGEGIEEKNLPKVWDRYYKIDKEHVRVSNGSGIGLALCREIMDLHKIQYGVNSKVGEGSTFWFALPIVKEERSRS